jgi:hypothetical protein
MTARLPDWQTRFGALVESRRLVPFEWGVNDCVTFAADAVHACIGVDPLAAERGYTTPQEASRILGGFGALAEFADARFGEQCGPRLARVGDTGLVIRAGRVSLVVCNGATWLGPGTHGLEALPLAAATRAWRA